MKGMRNIWILTAGLLLLSWVSACAGTDDMMGKDDTMAKKETMAKGGMMAKEDAMVKDGMMDKPGGMASPQKSSMGMEKKPQAMLMGSGGHHAAGRVSFGTGTMGTRVLTLSDIKVDKVPDGYVYLAKDGDWMHGVQLGRLKQFSGSVSFDLPADVDMDAYDTVVIWCKKFNVEIGRAHFGKKMM